MPWRRNRNDTPGTESEPAFDSPWTRDDDPPEKTRETAETAEPDLPPVPVHPIKSTDFSGAIAKNRRNTVLLCLFLTAIGCVLGFVIGAVIGQWIHPQATLALQGPLLEHKLVQAGLIGTAVMLLASLVWIVIALASGDRIIMNLAGGRKTAREEAEQLHNIVEEIAIAAGLPKPDVYVIETPALNAFATGLNPDKAAIGVTRGLLGKLNRQELQAVVAHEMGHIANNDVRYATAVGVLVGLIVLVSDSARRMMFYGGGRRSRSSRGGGAAVLTVIALLLAVLAPLAARMVQMAISREREYMADATAVKFTRHPTGLINALYKIGRSTTPYEGANRAMQHLFIANPVRVIGNKAGALFATHPSLDERIERLQNLG